MAKSAEYRLGDYPFPRGWVTFTLDPQGKVSEMKLDVPNPDFDFKELELKRAASARAAP